MTESQKHPLPSSPSALCFNKEEFMKDDFNIEQFIVECRRKVPLEMLRSDLHIYLKILQSAMIELINKDYADFVNLSTNLVGMDKAINNLLNPLGHLKNEILTVRNSMTEASTAVEEKMKHLSRIQTKKATLRTLMCMVHSVDKMEQLLGIKGYNSKERETSFNSEMTGQLIERVATEFNRLQFYVSQTSNLPLVDELKPRISAITLTLQTGLEAQFREGLVTGNMDILRVCLRTYATIDKIHDAESLYRSLIVKPYMEEIINEQYLHNNRLGLKAMYDAILAFFPKHYSQLRELTSGSSQSSGNHISGYDFVVNAVWPEVVANIEVRTSSIFAPGNPNVFHEKYTTSVKFVEQFERHCSSLASVRQLRAHPSYNIFMSKWSLSVYFQIRFQDIAGALEMTMFSPLIATSDKSAVFQLQCTSVLWQSMHRCWDSDIYLHPLCHRFWKLTLQLLSRYATWIEELKEEVSQSISHPETLLQSMPKTASEVNLAAMASTLHTSSGPIASNGSTSSLSSVNNYNNANQPKLEISSVVAVVSDIQLLTGKLTEFFTDVVITHLGQQISNENSAILKESIKDSESSLLRHLPQFELYVTNEIACLSVANLKAVSDIPRLYRRTNKEVPTKPSYYVASTFKPISEFLGEYKTVLDQINRTRSWTLTILQTVCAQYLTVTTDVLTSVKKMEESLKRLKAARGTNVAGGGQGMSDDDKIRLQLYLDVKEFGAQITSTGIDESDIESYVKLYELTESAVNGSSS